MKTVAIATFFDAPNYGAYFQALALKGYLESMNCAVRFLPTGIKYLLDDNNSYEFKISEILCQAQKENFLIGTLDEKFDLLILGSDEIWNLANKHVRNNKLFWGSGLKAQKKIAYAPSAIGSSWKRMLLKVPSLFQLDAISVRDSISAVLVNNFVKKDIQIVLDPTFLIEYDISDRYIDDKYILIYSYGLSLDRIKEIIKFARRNNLKTVATGCLAEWADYNPECSPFEWLSLFKFSRYVISSTFHGTVFSILFYKQFVAIGDNKKAQDLLKIFELEDRIVQAEEEISTIFDKMINYNKTKLIVEKMREESKEYLNRNLRN